jgi:hypothetical protein
MTMSEVKQDSWIDIPRQDGRNVGIVASDDHIYIRYGRKEVWRRGRPMTEIEKALATAVFSARGIATKF